MALTLRAIAAVVGVLAVAAGLVLAGFPWLVLAVTGAVLVAWGLLSEAP